MKALTEYINEKLVLSKDTFKYKYFPKTKSELVDILDQLLEERKDYNVVDLNDIDTYEITDMDWLFDKGADDSDAGQLLSTLNIRKIDISKWNVSSVKNMCNMFGECNKLISIGDLSSWDVSEVTNMYGMFAGCENLKLFGDLSKWNVSKVENMGYMFSECTKLESVGDLSKWNVSKVKNMTYMFYNCKNLKTIGNLSNWDISKVEYILDMFTDSGITNIPSWYKN